MYLYKFECCWKISSEMVPCNLLHSGDWACHMINQHANMCKFDLLCRKKTSHLVRQSINQWRYMCHCVNCFAIMKFATFAYAVRYIDNLRQRGVRVVFDDSLACTLQRCIQQQWCRTNRDELHMKHYRTEGTKLQHLYEAVGVIIHPCPNFNGGLARPPFKLTHR